MSKNKANLTVDSEKRKAFAERLNSLLQARGAKPDLSRKIGASVQAIRKWCNGETEPSRDYLVATANALNISVEWLATGKGSDCEVSANDNREFLLPDGFVELLVESYSQVETFLNHKNITIQDNQYKIKLVIALAEEAYENQENIINIDHYVRLIERMAS